jgi:hypothetical protein
MFSGKWAGAMGLDGSGKYSLEQAPEGKTALQPMPSARSPASFRVPDRGSVNPTPLGGTGM